MIAIRFIDSLEDTLIVLDRVNSVEKGNNTVFMGGKTIPTYHICFQFVRGDKVWVRYLDEIKRDNYYNDLMERIPFL